MTHFVILFGTREKVACSELPVSLVVVILTQARVQTDSKDAMESVRISRNEYIQLNSNYIVTNIIC